MRGKPQLLAMAALVAGTLLAMRSAADDSSKLELERAQAMLEEMGKQNARHRRSNTEVDAQNQYMLAQIAHSRWNKATAEVQSLQSKAEQEGQTRDLRDELVDALRRQSAARVEFYRRLAEFHQAANNAHYQIDAEEQPAETVRPEFAGKIVRVSLAATASSPYAYQVLENARLTSIGDRMFLVGAVLSPLGQRFDSPRTMAVAWDSVKTVTFYDSLDDFHRRPMPQPSDAVSARHGPSGSQQNTE